MPDDNAKPLTRREWQRMRFGAAYPNTHDSHAHVAFDASGADRIEATIEAGGFAPEEPTKLELDRWAAEHIRGWQDSGYGYWTYRGQNVDMGKIMDMEAWRPTRDLGQALGCASKAGYLWSMMGGGMTRTVVRLRAAGHFNHEVYAGSYVTDVIAERIMRYLYNDLST